jgi:hypothetical protein
MSTHSNRTECVFFKKTFRVREEINIVLRIFSINHAKLTEVKEQYFPLENTVQRITESNLHALITYIPRNSRHFRIHLRIKFSLVYYLILVSTIVNYSKDITKESSAL